MTSEMLSQYLDRALAASDRAELEHHLADCADCRAELIQVARVLRGARYSGTRRWAFALAAGLGIILVAWQSQTSTRMADEFRTGTTLTWTVLTPADGDSVVLNDVTFRWRRQHPDARYRLTVSTSAGEPVWQTTTSDTAVTPPDSIVSRWSGPYFWIVDAIRLDGSSVSSEPRRVVLRP